MEVHQGAVLEIPEQSSCAGSSRELNPEPDTIAGVELLGRVRKGQFTLGSLRIEGQAALAVLPAYINPSPRPLLPAEIIRTRASVGRYLRGMSEFPQPS
jgi:hypothetical protein